MKKYTDFSSVGIDGDMKKEVKNIVFNWVLQETKTPFNEYSTESIMDSCNMTLDFLRQASEGSGLDSEINYIESVLPETVRDIVTREL